jgi:hypothetical protein
MRNCIIALALVTGGCATPVTKIEAAKVDASGYANMTCPELQAAYRDNEAVLAPLEREQAHRVESDTNAFWMIGVTPTMVAPRRDREAGIAEGKGKAAAILQRAVAINCNVMTAIIPPA